MNYLILVLTVVHFAALSGLALYGVHRLWMLYHWWQYTKVADDVQTISFSGAWPQVTVQLPLYNERFVAERLINAVAHLDWPSSCLQIQVVDDSSDETCAVVDRAVARWRARGINIVVQRRASRIGYKAGALAAALEHATGEFVAIFDADFVPDADYLQSIMPYFAGADVAMVQARWGFLNRTHSWLTKLQAILLGAHFAVEHQVRYRRGLFFNFNGTAGVWRRSAIAAAGGWQADTVTEDLDLSYRAQMQGWRFIYVNDVVVPSELPLTVNDFRGQQQRWAKGSTQTARKILPILLRTDLPMRVKIEAGAHLLANFGWLCAALACLTLYPALLSRGNFSVTQVVLLDVPLFFLAGVAILLYFALYAVREYGWRSLLWLPVLPMLTLGLSPSLAWSVMCGTVQRGGVFARTAKYGMHGKQQGKMRFCVDLSSVKADHRLLLVNGILVLYSCLPAIYVLQRHEWAAIFLVLLFPLGFLLVFFSDAVALMHRHPE